MTSPCVFFRPSRIGWFFLPWALLLPPDSAAQYQSIRFDQISIEQGLTQDTVTCILQDRVGFIWLGTQDGLNRFDGNSFVAFKHDPDYPATLPNDYVQALEEDASGDIWVGTRGGGLSRWQRQTDQFIHYQHDPLDPASLSGNQVPAIFQDRRGVLWVGTDHSGLNRFDVATGGFEHFRQQPQDPASLGDDRVRGMHDDSSGQLWIATLGGLHLLDRSSGRFRRFQHPEGSAYDSALSILEDQAGQLWIATFGGLARFDRDTESFDLFRHDPADPGSLSPGRARTLYQDRELRLWIGTDGGLDLWQPATESFVHYRHSPADASSLSADRVMSIYQDRGDVLWVGTERGVSKWNPKTWTFSPYKGDPTRSSQHIGNDVFSITEGKGRELWVGTSSHGLDRLDREHGTVSHFRHDPADPSSLSGNRVTALYHDHREVLWVGTLGKGLNRFERSSETFVHYSYDAERADSLGGDAVAAIFEDASRTLWIGAFGGGLNRFDRGREAATSEDAGFHRFQHDPADPSSLSNDRVTSFAEDAQGRLWIGTFEGGLNLFDRSTETFQRFRADAGSSSSLSSDMVFSVHAGDGGSLWIGTQIGLNRAVPAGEGTAADFDVYLERDGLPNDVVYGIQPDQQGGLWLSTNGGLSRFDPETETFKNYDVSHGLQSNEFHMGAHYRSASGELYFGGIDGFNAFFPERIESNDAIPPVVLTAFSKLNEPVTFDRPIFDVREISLGHRDSIISFEFAALDYTAPSRNQYRYRLEGFSADWIELGNRRLVSLTNLDPGHYRLRVMGSNNDGVWNEEGVSIAIDVAPPPWKTWWANTLYVLTLATAVWGFVSSQHRKVERERAQVRERERLISERERLITELEEKNAELERFNYTVSHDLKSPLVTIKGFLGLLQQDADAGNRARMDHDIGRIATAADRMYRLLEELLDLSRIGRQAHPPEEVPLSELAVEAVELVGGQIDKSSVEVAIDSELPVVSGDRGRLLEVFQNLLANAVTYMGDQTSPRVEVGVERKGSETTIYVRDNGIGIDARYHEKVFGLFERLATDQDGTGVGLALVKRIVEMHSGKIWVESAGPGQGSTFYFTLGLPQEPTPHPGEPAAAT